MSDWFFHGIRTGIKTTHYPAKPETAAGVSPGLPVADGYPAGEIASLVECCPTQVFRESEGRLIVDNRRCIHCYRCVHEAEHPAYWDGSYEWALAHVGKEGFPHAFQKSIHICVVDAGDCGACLNEVKQLNNPYYNMHRLGFFITPTPRHADILLVVGPVTDHMKYALNKAYEAMPTPKRVVAVGACALTGGVFAGSFACAKGVGEVLPVDVEVPGNPPPPLAILHGLLVAAGRKPPVNLLPAAATGQGME
jgi:Ni,Fe-hydrogenase III small subunit